MRHSNDERRCRRGHLIAAALAAALLQTAGCGGEDRLPLFPASGTVLVDGQPARGVEIRLHPVGSLDDFDALRPFARSGEDGSFRLGSFEKEDGAPEGRYKVTLFLPDGPIVDSRPPVDLLGGRFADPARTKLEVTITGGENHLDPFEVEKVAAPPRRPQVKPARPDTDGVD